MQSLKQLGERVAAGLKNRVVLTPRPLRDRQRWRLLRREGNSVGVLHPLQAVPDAERGMETLPGAAYAFAGDDAAYDWARLLIKHLDGKPLAVDPAHWRRHHAAAVMASNYNATLVDAALELMGIAGAQ